MNPGKCGCFQQFDLGRRQTTVTAQRRMISVMLITGLVAMGFQVPAVTAGTQGKMRPTAKAKMAAEFDRGQEYANSIVAAVLAATEAVRSSASYRRAMQVLRNPSAFSGAHGHLSRFQNNLDWSNIDPVKYERAGMREGIRESAAARRIWETIPIQTRAQGPEATARALLGKDWSHVEAHSKGGSNAASNGIFENASLNRSRGNTRMTAQEIRAAQDILRSHAFHATLLESAKNAMKGAVFAAAIMAVVAILEYGLLYQQGEITEHEMYLAIGKAIALAGISGAAVSGLVTAMALTFPAIMPVLAAISVPLMVIGFSVMGVKLVTLGQGWYEVYISEQPLKPMAFRYWMARQYQNAKANAVDAATMTAGGIREFMWADWRDRSGFNFR